MNPEGTLLLTRKDIAALMKFGDYVAALEEAFRLYAQGKVQLPGLVHMDAPDGAFHIKAARLTLRKTYVAVKVNGNFPQNRSLFGLPTIQGAITLCDGSTGYPLAFLDSTEITLQRTGAATALAGQYLARPDSAVATICGCGRQGRIQLVGLKHALPLARAYAFDLRAEAAEAFAREMTTYLGISVIPVRAVSDSVPQSDVVVTCTTARQPFLRREDVRPGAFIAAVGADSPDKQELDPSVMASNKIVVDVLEQCATIGELHHALRQGLVRRADVYAELGEIVDGRKPGRTSPEEIIIFDSTGTALQDVAAAAAIYERARAAGIGYVCPLSR